MIRSLELTARDEQFQNAFAVTSMAGCPPNTNSAPGSNMTAQCSRSRSVRMADGY